jgi:hypothetical protein
MKALFSMSWRKALVRSSCGLLFLGMLYAAQREFKQYHGVEYPEFELPPDWQRPGEWAFARLMYPPGPNDGYRGRWFIGIGGRECRSGRRIIRGRIGISQKPSAV